MITPVVLANEGAVTSVVAASINASLDEYDLSYNHDNQTVSNVLAGCFLNMRMSDVFNFDAPWWTQTADSFTIATIMEAMGHNCVYDVLPLAYESALQVRFSDSPNDAKAYEIIRDSMLVDIGYAFNERCSGLSPLVRALSNLTPGTMSSEIARNQKPLNKALQRMNDNFREMNAMEYGN